MMDLSHWDFAEHFRGKEAAELIMGIPPEENSGWQELLGGERGYTAKITPLLRRMERALNGGLNTLHAAATWGGSAKDALIAFPLVPSELHSETMVKARESATEFGLSIFKNQDWTGKFGNAYFDRSEIARWLDAIGMKSVYQFDHKQPDAIPAPVGRWPWGNHHTELLGHLEAAAHEFWTSYDPQNQKTTAPKNETVIAWLEKRKVSGAMSKAIATMLRPNDLPSGPRK
jgi:hypothetical protein